MYYSSTSEKPQSLYLWFYNSLNEEFRALSLCKFGDWIIHFNPIIIIDKSNKSILGYMIIDEINLIKSKYYDYFKDRTLLFQHIDPTNAFAISSCHRIISWAFDIILDNKDSLSEIFSIFAAMYAEKEKVGFVWTDSQGFLDYYPLRMTNNKEQFNTEFVYHFIDSFYQEIGNAPE